MTPPSGQGGQTPRHRHRMRLAPEGTVIIVASALLVVAAVAFSLLRAEGRGLWLPAVTALWFLAVVQFFRDPERFAPEGEGLIVSPADGKIIVAGDFAGGALKGPGKRVSIFMSPVNVHVNRAPVSGMVGEKSYNRGKFHSAFKDAASRENERTTLVIDNPKGAVAMTQVAGYLARRIVCHPKVGDRVERGGRIGMIRFGSRVDLDLPENIKLQVNIGDRVTAGETIVGVYPNVK